MVFSLENHQTGVGAGQGNGSVHLHALLQRTAVILVRVQEQGGGGHLGGVLQGRLLPEQAHGVINVAAVLVGDRGEAHVGIAPEGEHVGDGPLRGGAGEAVSVADDPVGQKAAVGAAGDGHTLRVNLGPCLQGGIVKGHQAFVVQRAVAGTDGLEKFGALAVRADGVAENHEISLGGQQLQLVVIHGGVDVLGAAVNFQHGGVALVGVVIGGGHDKAVDGVLAVLCGHVDRLGHRLVGQHGVIQAGQTLRLAAQQIQFVQGHVVLGHGVNFAVGGHIKAADGAGVVAHSIHLAANVDANQMDVVDLAGQTVQVLAVTAEGRGETPCAVAEGGVFRVEVGGSHRDVLALFLVQQTEGGILVEGVADAVAHHHHQAAFHLAKVQNGQVLLFIHGPVGSGGRVGHADVVKLDAQLFFRGARVGNAVAKAGDMGHMEPLGAQLGQLTGCRVVQVQGVDGGRGVAQSVEAHGQTLYHRTAGGGRNLVPGGEEPTGLVQFFHALDEEGQGEGLFHAAVGEGQPLPAGIALDHGGNQQVAFVLPEEDVAFAVAGQGAGTSAIPQPDVVAVGIVFFVAGGDGKGGTAAVGRGFHSVEKMVIEEIAKLDGGHRKGRLSRFLLVLSIIVGGGKEKSNAFSNFQNGKSKLEENGVRRYNDGEREMRTP